MGALTRAGEKQKEKKGRKPGSKKLKHICRSCDSFMLKCKTIYRFLIRIIWRTKQICHVQSQHKNSFYFHLGPWSPCISLRSWQTWLQMPVLSPRDCLCPSDLTREVIPHIPHSSDSLTVSFTSSVSITGDLVSNSDSQAPPWSY